MLSLLASLWYRAERSLDVKIGEQPSSGENTRGLHSAESDSQKTYVGNLSFQTTETDLSDMFGEIGQVESVKIITDREAMQSPYSFCPRFYGWAEQADSSR